MSYTKQEIKAKLESGEFTPAEQAILRKAMESAPEDKTVSGFGSNLVDSAVEFGKDFVQLPIDAISMAAGGSTNNPSMAGIQALTTEQGREALGQYYKERYGGVENFQDTLYEDPVGVLSDLAMFAMPASVAKNAAKAAQKVGVPGSDVVSSAFENAQRILEKADPINAGVLAFNTGVNKLAADDYATKVYQEIIKPSNTIPNDTKKRIIQHMLDTGITPDMEGANLAQSRISDALAQSDELIENSNEVMTPDRMLTYYANEANPTASTINQDATSVRRAKVAQRRYDELEDSFIDGQPLTAQEVRAQRRVFDDEVNYGKSGKANTSSDNAKLDKGQADHLRRELGEMVPEIKPLNEQISNDIPAKEFAELAEQRYGNNNTIGLGAKMMGSGNLWKGLLMMTADNPANKGRFARYVNSVKNDPLVLRDSPLAPNARSLLQFEGRQGEYVMGLLEELMRKEEDEE